MATPTTVHLEIERMSPSGHLSRVFRYVSTDSRIGQMFVGQGRAIRIDIVEHTGDTLTYTLVRREEEEEY